MNAWLRVGSHVMSPTGPAISSAVCAIGSACALSKSLRIRKVWVMVSAPGGGLPPDGGSVAGADRVTLPSDPPGFVLVHDSPSYPSSVNMRQ